MSSQRQTPSSNDGANLFVHLFGESSIIYLPSRHDLRDACTELARDAARAIMHVYAGGFIQSIKADSSPVTDADHAAEAIIVKGLRALTPGAPVVAEEEVASGCVPVVDTAPFWLVDPLDGTKEFIKRNGEFTVNIALIENGEPTLGIVLAPALGVVWRGDSTLGADKCDPSGTFERIFVRAAPRQLTAFVSRSTAIDSDLDRWFDANGVVAERKPAGSSLKFCLIAEGQGDLYPRLGPTHEWDTAAGQAVLEAAGGSVATMDGTRLPYGKAAFRNPPFIASSKVPFGKE
jgi:3'(2'), 5'-bisphosphate nucleotidase